MMLGVSSRPESVRFYPLVDNLATLKLMAGLGFGWVQWRNHASSKRELRTVVREFRANRRSPTQKLILNNDAALATALDFDGVHLGQEDLPGQRKWLASARQTGLLVGISTHSHTEIETALTLNPDYLAIGALFPSPSKPTREVLDHRLVCQWIREYSRLCRATWVGIGGINATNAHNVFALGFSTAAFISWNQSIVNQALSPRELWRQIETLRPSPRP
jgi:thiamine-phosphate pyrophosphorylase